ncbi:undecaprenyl/decaprenyl-phosphate alpha-N-acetylglucosaminyl 1-phosphate transferase [Candidatus Dependentiae bacterium]|nr:undecaprenyl/decaprenyl-phosphate alpha-N-acetylglucosaminyl 1-phosphate transferase [Candidatus Dependentiae bacterium]
MDTLLIKSLFAVVIAFLITFYLIPILHAVALKLGIVDIPDGRIKLHSKVTPYLGGVGIFVGFICSLSLVLPFDNSYSLFFIGLTLLVCLGLIDDLIALKPLQKFIGQCIAALAFLKAGLYLKERFFQHMLFAIPLSFFWMLSVINAFNLIDIMDGLATTVAIVAGISFMIIALLYQQGAVLILCSALVGALIGFFWYNKPVAKMYMGDAGALFLGGFMAAMPFLFEWGKYNQFGFLIPLIILAIPLLELASLVVIRSYKRIPFYRGSPHHFALFLRRKGWSVWQILCFSAIMGTMLMGVGIGFAVNWLTIGQIVMMFFLIILGWIATVFS